MHHTVHTSMFIDIVRVRKEIWYSTAHIRQLVLSLLYCSIIHNYI
jgi:hypothetical protein